MEYELLDSGHGQKLERFGKLLLIRPSPVALWSPKLSKKEWQKAHARFSREKGNRWQTFSSLPETWVIKLEKLHFELKRTEFGHLGIFPEHRVIWRWIEKRLRPRSRFLNLFAYSGGASLIAARAGSIVTHLDSAKGMVNWAQKNAQLNDISSIRWLVEDARKYLERAIRRKEQYDAILLDPPSFGRGKSNEVFKIERDLPLMLSQCRDLLSNKPLFVMLTCHTPGLTPLVLRQMLQDGFEGKFEEGDLILKGPFDIPSGTYASWEPC